MNEEIIDILKEFEDKRVEQLSENSRKLFYAVMSIADDRYRLKQENNKLKIDISARETVCDDYKSRIDKALSLTNRIIEIIKQQPSEDDTWILDNLHSIKYLLQGSDKE